MKEVKARMMAINFILPTTDKPTFRLIPLDKGCPFIDAIYYPKERELDVMTRYKKTVPGKGKEPAEEIFHEFSINDVEDIRSFIKLNVVNPDHRSLAIIK